MEKTDKMTELEAKLGLDFINKNLLKELDCPLDSTTMNNERRMKNIDKKLYEYYQNKFEGEEKIRILKDMKYGFRRLKEFFKD